MLATIVRKASIDEIAAEMDRRGNVIEELERRRAMDARSFHNALRILLNLGQHDLAAAGVIDRNWGSADASDRDQVEAFTDDPIREALRMPDANFDRLFALIESRQPKRGIA